MRLIKVAILYLILSLASVPFMEPAQSASSWQEDWERIIQAAKKEGKVSVVGFLAREVREVLTQPFEKRFGISVEYLAVSGPETPPKIGAERKAGQYLWDIFVGGTVAFLREVLPR
jgi:hypothetical protein